MEQTTVEAVRAAARQLAAAGVETPQACAEWLLTDVTAMPRPSLYAAPRPLESSETARYTDWVAQVCHGVPPAYLTRQVWFFGLPLAVQPGVFIPRPETEVLVEAVLSRWEAGASEPMIGLDVGTGSGNIAVSLTRLLPDARMVLLDVSEEALAVARRNAVAHGVADRMHLACADLRQAGWWNVAGQPFTWIVSNPPYIASGAMATLPALVRSEPACALDGGSDGLALLREIVARAPSLLRPSGWLALEIGEDQAVEVALLIAQTRAFGDAEIKQDLAGRDRVVLAQRRDG